jgi:hypothetical protein
MKTVDASALGIKTDGKYFKLCKILREFPSKLREYYRMNINIFYYILDCVKGDM